MSDIRKRFAAHTESQQRRSTEGDHSLADEDAAIEKPLHRGRNRTSRCVRVLCNLEGRAEGQALVGGFGVAPTILNAQARCQMMHNTALQPTANPLRGLSAAELGRYASRELLRYGN